MEHSIEDGYADDSFQPFGQMTFVLAGKDR
jgi:hypothetical protein